MIACSAALKLDPISAKALFRRGTARMRLSEFSEAKQDLLRAAQIDPKSIEIRQAYQKCKDAEREATQRSKQTFARMFS